MTEERQRCHLSSPLLTNLASLLRASPEEYSGFPISESTSSNLRAHLLGGCTAQHYTSL